jgi:hypothetical protein
MVTIEEITTFLFFLSLERHGRIQAAVYGEDEEFYVA